MKKTSKTKKVPPLERIADALENIAKYCNEKTEYYKKANKEIESKNKKIPKCIIKDFPEFIGKSKKELYEYLKKEYSNQLAGEDEISDIFKNPEKYPELKDGNWYY